MIIHPFEQHSEEWYSVRAGKFTGSIAGKLVTPTGRVSTQYKSEIARIIAEYMGWQKPETIKPTYWMERGTDMESEARNWFQVDTDIEIQECGFIESDGGLTGFSPDGYTEDEGFIIPIELKCPKPSTHVQWVLDGGLPKEHAAQVHFGMAITGAPYAYFMGYHPICEPVFVKVERGDYTATMVDMINKYAAEFEVAFKRITGIEL
jgi:hypothetical protein